MDISYGGAMLGLTLASALMWGVVIGFAYARRQFGGSARGYFAVFLILWLATIAFFVGLTIWENRPTR